MTLKKIYKKYHGVSYTENYCIGGGLAGARFESKRHENAKWDEGKLTLGKAVQMFKRATELDTSSIKEIIMHGVPEMEWHHAGKLPKQYGGGMKKTYFLNANEICMLAEKWNELIESLERKKQEKKERELRKQELEIKRKAFLQEKAKMISRVETIPPYFYCIYKECTGKYGWFDANKNIYGLTEYSTGWKFDTEKDYLEFLNIKL